MTHKNQTPMDHRRKGSALLLTLLVVSLLLGIVLAFVTFVRLDLRQVESKHQLQQARSVSRLGMELALARLQDTTGPDQRITARADVFDGSSENVYQDSLTANIEKSKWVGVWDATSFKETDPQAKTFLGWLVSGAEEDVDLVADVETAYSNEDELITLVGTGSVANESDQVKVPKVSVGDGAAYAWWVKDENMAARFDTSDPYRNSTDALKRQFSLHSAQRYAVELMNVDTATVLGDSLFPYEHPTFTNLVERVASLDQIPLIWKSSPTNMDVYQKLIQNRYHDLSLVSRGLLVDVKNGGLRQDLNMAFEMPYDKWVESDYVKAHAHHEVPIYQPPGYPKDREIAPMIRISDFSPYGFTPESSKGPREPSPVPYDNPEPERLKTNRSVKLPPVLRGPPWDLFRNYYRLYKSNDSDLVEYGFPSSMNVQHDGSLLGRSPFPSAHGYYNARRYGQDPLVWDYAEIYGPWGTNYSRSLPMGRPVLPGISPVVIRLQNVVSFKTRVVSGVNPAAYHLDMYLDPVVTIWNPYNVRLKTGRDYGQPLVLGVKFLNLRPFIRANIPSTGETREMEASFTDLFDNYAPVDSDYISDKDQTFQLELDLGSYILEPGEILVFSHPGPVVPYYRNENMDPDDPDYSDSGMHITLKPGVDKLMGDSGMVFENIVRFLSNNDLFTDGQLPSETEMRFKMEPGIAESILKFQVVGIGADGKEPFMSSFQAGLDKISTQWTVDDFTPGDLKNSKRPTLYFDSFLKHADSLNPINLFSQYNVRALTFEQGTSFNIQSSAYTPQSGSVDKVEDVFWGQGVVVNDLNGLIAMDGDNGFWGPTNQSAGINDWNTHIPLFDVPRAPMTSLANFQHVPVSIMADEPSYVVGNSLASIFVGYAPLSLQKLNPSDKFWNAGYSPGRLEWTMTRVDWSYLLNQVLFDSYYFSGIAPTSGYTTSKAQLEDHIQNNTPLHNSPYHFRAANGEDSDDILNRLFDENGEPTPLAPREMSSHLMVDGMFNINSTSVNAWKALLASTRKIKVETQESGEVHSSGTVYTRMSIPYTGENDEWTGFRSLSDAQIERLAEEIVIQIKERGPFLNLSDFVNRRASDQADPSTVHEHMKMGALEAAIRASSINDGYITDRLADKGMSSSKNEINSKLRDRVDRNSKVSEGVSGYVTQADILSVIGPILSARSDTFTIRSYGAYEDASGNVLSKAWCEAVVQRVPEYQDSHQNISDFPPHENPANVDSYDTSPPRRKYEIVRFRWLDPEEI
ncbi:hypothetical protein P0Y35_02815 [Kiritimatiellaeota bacterium B1221]|nr:hypothetical protein [Kiritimatiellaeota bacterium B1221]